MHDSPQGDLMVSACSRARTGQPYPVPDGQRLLEGQEGSAVSSLTAPVLGGASVARVAP